MVVGDDQAEGKLAILSSKELLPDKINHSKSATFERQQAQRNFDINRMEQL